MAELAEALSFGRAWRGWAHVAGDETVIHANAVHHPPSHYLETWIGMADQDLHA